MKRLILFLSLILAGCSSTTTQPASTFVQYNGSLYVVLPAPMSTLATGDLVLFRMQGAQYVAILGTARGDGVFRIVGDGFTLITSSNYIGKLAGGSPLPSS